MALINCALHLNLALAKKFSRLQTKNHNNIESWVWGELELLGLRNDQGAGQLEGKAKAPTT